MALCNAYYAVYIFENGFFKRKLKLKLSLAHFQRQNIIGSRRHTHTRTHTHIDGDVDWQEWHEVSDVRLMLRLLWTLGLSSEKHATTGHLMCYILEKFSEYCANL